MQRKLISFDWAIKKILRSKANFVVIEGLLTTVLNKKINILELLESESNREAENDKYNRVDMLVRAEDDELIIIEVQATRQFDYFHRMVYGTSKTVSEHFKKAQEYEHVKKVISVNIVYFELGHGDDYVYHGTTNFIGLHTKNELELSSVQKELYEKERVCDIFPEHFILKINNFNDFAKDSLDEWIYFLKNEEIKPEFRAPGLVEASEILDVLKLSAEDRAIYEQEMENLSYEESITKSNFKAGKLEGMKEGVQKGEKIGIKKGRAEGEHLAKIEIAKNLLSQNVSVEVIVSATSLSAEEIKKIKTESFVQK